MPCLVVVVTVRLRRGRVRLADTLAVVPATPAPILLPHAVVCVRRRLARRLTNALARLLVVRRCARSHDADRGREVEKRRCLFVAGLRCTTAIQHNNTSGQPCKGAHAIHANVAFALYREPRRSGACVCSSCRDQLVCRDASGAHLAAQPPSLPLSFLRAAAHARPPPSRKGRCACCRCACFRCACCRCARPRCARAQARRLV